MLGDDLPHDLAVRCLDMAMQVWPAQARNITVALWAVVLQQQPCVVKSLWVLEMYA